MMLTETEVLDQLERSMAPGGVFLRHVRSRRADGGVERTIDGVHVGLSPSRGYTVTAYEVKRSRGDLRAELENVDKADWWGQAADAFYLAVTDHEMLAGLPIPSEWGVLSVSLHGVREHRPPIVTARGVQAKNPTVPRNVMAALVDAARKASPSQDIDRSSLMALAEQAVTWGREKADREIRTHRELAEGWRYRIADLLGLSEPDAERLVLEAADHDWTARVQAHVAAGGSQYEARKLRIDAADALRAAADAIVRDLP